MSGLSSSILAVLGGSLLLALLHVYLHLLTQRKCFLFWAGSGTITTVGFAVMLLATQEIIPRERVAESIALLAFQVAGLLLFEGTRAFRKSKKTWFFCILTTGLVLETLVALYYQAPGYWIFAPTSLWVGSALIYMGYCIGISRQGHFLVRWSFFLIFSIWGLGLIGCSVSPPPSELTPWISILVAALEITAAFMTLLFFLDVAQRKLDETTLRLQLFEDNTPGGVFQAPAKPSWHFDYISPGIAGFSGLTYDQLTREGKLTYDNLILAEDREKVNRIVSEAVANKNTYNVEYRIRRRDGRTLWIDEQARCVYNHRGTPLWRDGVLMDVTERKEADNMLLLLRHLIDNVDEALFILEAATGRLLDVNQRACDLLGYSYPDLCRSNLMTIDARISTPDRCAMLVQHVNKQGKAFWKSVYQRKDGSTCNVEIMALYVPTLERDYLVMITRPLAETSPMETPVPDS